MNFGVAERAIGKYLSWQNPGRQKIGRSWEAEQQRITAGVRLESVTRELRRQTTALESISNFDDLAQYVETNQQALLSPGQFFQIYRELPIFLQYLLADPDSLVADARSQRLANVLINGNRSRFNLVVLDPYNRVIRQTSLTAAQMDRLVNYGKERTLNIHAEPRFSEYLFSAEEFFELFERLNPTRRHQFIRELPLLTESADQIVAVGISAQNQDEFVEVAFAIANDRAYIYFLPEDWVMDLLSPDRQRAFEFYWKRRNR